MGGGWGRGLQRGVESFLNSFEEILEVLTIKSYERFVVVKVSWRLSLRFDA